VARDVRLVVRRPPAEPRKLGSRSSRGRGGAGGQHARVFPLGRRRVLAWAPPILDGARLSQRPTPLSWPPSRDSEGCRIPNEIACGSDSEWISSPCSIKLMPA
jgi:hypothetical protein